MKDIKNNNNNQNKNNNNNNNNNNKEASIGDLYYMNLFLLR